MLVNELWQQFLSILVQGLLVGLVFGFLIRRLNKIIAATLGIVIFTLNALWLARILGLEANLRSLALQMNLDLNHWLSSLLMLAVPIPLLVGFLMGTAIGFKLS